MIQEIKADGSLPLDVFGDEQSPRVRFVKAWWSSVDGVSIICVLALAVIGMLLGMASSVGLAERHELGDFHYVRRQLFFVSLAFIAMVATSMCSAKAISKASVFGFGAVAFALALLPVLGTDFGKGAARWYSFAGLSIQPSEFLKPLFAVFCGGLLGSARADRMSHSVNLSAGIMLAVVGILVLQPDFGQAALILAAWILMYLASGSSLSGLCILGAVVTLGGIFAYEESEHVARRINSFLSSDVDPTEQVGYSLRAIQSGGMFGSGVGEGSVKFTLPDAHTDFIIAVAAEEYGFVLVAIILGLYLTIVLRSFVRLMLDPNHFKRVIGTGLTALLGLQALINIGVSARFFPAKGMTLPFVSYGGSSAIAIGLTFGCLFAFTRRLAEPGIIEPPKVAD